MLFSQVDDEEFVIPVHGYEELVVSGHENFFDGSVFQISLEDLPLLVDVEDVTCLCFLLLAEENVGVVVGQLELLDSAWTDWQF